MSAVGQKQTFAPQKAMSALPPKADICGAKTNVCFGPRADIVPIRPRLSARHLLRRQRQKLRRGFQDPSPPWGLVELVGERAHGNRDGDALN